MRALQALLGAVIGGALIVAGVAVLAGLGWALITAGVWITGTVVLLYDSELRKPRKGIRRGGFRVDGP